MSSRTPSGSRHPASMACRQAACAPVTSPRSSSRAPSWTSAKARRGCRARRPAGKPRVLLPGQQVTRSAYAVLARSGLRDSMTRCRVAAAPAASPRRCSRSPRAHDACPDQSVSPASAASQYRASAPSGSPVRSSAPASPTCAGGGSWTRAAATGTCPASSRTAVPHRS